MESKLHYPGTRGTSGVLVVVFLTWIVLPSVVMVLSPRQAVSTSEKRKLAALPPLPGSISAINEFPGKFEAFFNDHFGLRSAMVKARSYLMFKGFGETGNWYVVRGNDGFLIFDKKDGPVTPSISDWSVTLRQRGEWLKRKGIKFVFTVVPSVETVYPGVLPAGYVRSGEKNLELVCGAAAKTPNVVVVDIARALAQAAQNGPLYYKQDSHWNDRGAYYASREIASRLAQAMPGRIGPPEFQLLSEPVFYTGDLIKLIGLDGLVAEPATKLTRAPAWSSKAVPVSSGQVPANAKAVRILENGDKKLPRAVIIHDSYLWDERHRWLGELFSRSVFIWALPGQFYPDLIARERPDVVIWEVAERSIVESTAGLHDWLDDEVAAALNLAVNGGFEQWAAGSPYPDAWKPLANAPDGLWASTDAKKGRACLGLRGAREKNVYVQIPLSVPMDELRGHRIRVSGWLRASEPGMGGILIVTDWTDYQTTKPIPANSWQKVEVKSRLSFTAKSIYLALTVHAGHETGSLLFDDISVTIIE